MMFGIYTASPDNHSVAQPEIAKFVIRLEIIREIIDAPEFYYAEDYHQQYLSKNPMGYCGLGGTGVSCPVGLT